MIEPRTLLIVLRQQLKALEDDIRDHLGEQPERDAELRADWQAARDSGRVAAAYPQWRDEEITQAAVHWVLACVFLRVIEDQSLVDRPWLSGATQALRELAQDRHDQYFRQHPLHSDRDYLIHCFEDAARLPALGGLFDRAHNPLWRIRPSGDGAMALLGLWRAVDPDRGTLRLDFSAGPASARTSAPGLEQGSADGVFAARGRLAEAAPTNRRLGRRQEAQHPPARAPNRSGQGATDDAFAAQGFAAEAAPTGGGEGDWTRFLGDLYQDLSEPVCKKCALLQTPEFVEEFILDRTLTPAIREFGYHRVRMIDPTCGSGHFLLGAFNRLFDLWAANEPTRNLPDLVQRALDAVHGIDINPYAVAIARFRLIVAALTAAGVRHLVDAPDFQIHVAVGDSLLHGRRFTDLDLGGEADLLAGSGFGHAFATEDQDAVNRILGQRYHAVVGNPPYITVKDPGLNALYRQLYPDTCHMKYSLVVPFAERFFNLAQPATRAEPAGYVGLIVADSFMKREFGKKLIEGFLPRLDLTHVIATSGAYIPGHGTPTVILFGRNRSPTEPSVRTVMGIKGEPGVPEDPAQGRVWTAILDQLDRAGSEGEFVSVADVPREVFGRHPWSIGGGGAADLKEEIECVVKTRIKSVATDVGITSVTGEDDGLLREDRRQFERLGIRRVFGTVVGDAVRDWRAADLLYALWPYDTDFRALPLSEMPDEARYLWTFRSILSQRKRFGTPMVLRGYSWYEFQELYTAKLRTHLTITYAEVATHNHFVLDRGGKVFNRTAPVIKLPAGATEDDHLALLELLNSSTGCYWLKQVCFPKGGDQMGGKGARVSKNMWEERFAHDGTKVGQFPLAEPYPTDLARRLDALAQQLTACLPAAVLATQPSDPTAPEQPDD